MLYVRLLLYRIIMLCLVANFIVTKVTRKLRFNLCPVPTKAEAIKCWERIINRRRLIITNTNKNSRKNPSVFFSSLSAGVLFMLLTYVIIQWHQQDILSLQPSKHIRISAGLAGVLQHKDIISSSDGLLHNYKMADAVLCFDKFINNSPRPYHIAFLGESIPRFQFSSFIQVVCLYFNIK